jgi:hypothetical protein
LTDGISLMLGTVEVGSYFMFVLFSSCRCWADLRGDPDHKFHPINAVYAGYQALNPAQALVLDAGICMESAACLVICASATLDTLIVGQSSHELDLAKNSFWSQSVFANRLSSHRSCLCKTVL